MKNINTHSHRITTTLFIISVLTFNSLSLAAVSQTPMTSEESSIQFKAGEIGDLVVGAKLFTDRDYKVEELPDWLKGKKFLRSGIDGCSFTVTAGGVLTVITADVKTNESACQSQALEELGFTKIEKPALFQFVGKKGCVYQKVAKTGEKFKLEKIAVVAGFLGATKMNAEMSPWSQNNGEILYNGIVLPAQWPPNYDRDPNEPMPVPYLDYPPAVIPINVGRQLLVDNFLIQDTNFKRTFHTPEYHPANPVLRPDKPWEFLNGGSYAAPFSGGVCFDPADKLFKMWYTGGCNAALCYATSKDGINWDKPELDVKAPGTNIVLNPGRDRASYKTLVTQVVLMDDTDPEARFKYIGVELTSGNKPKFVTAYRTSTDGIHWSELLAAGNESIGDRTTGFYNPFRRKWVLSEKISWLGRSRAYRENSDPMKVITEPVSVKWFAADKLDPRNPAKEYDVHPQIYNFDAAPYESLMLGQFSVWQGPDNRYCDKHNLQKRNDILIGYSRDGFHWDRPDRTRFISSSWDVNDWRFGNVQSVGGGCLVVGDKLYFYFSGRAKPDIGFYGDAGKSYTWYSSAATGLAVLRRDGFASMDADDKGGSLTTRPLTFKGKYLFVNVDANAGELNAEILDKSGKIILDYSAENCKIVKNVDSTIYQIEWNGDKDLSSLADTPVRIRFTMKNAKLYAFWVSPDKNGASRGYVAAGGPGFTGLVDTVGKDSYK